jgi:hypothetical protein
MDLLKEYIKKRENPVILDIKGEFVFFSVNKAMQTTVVRYLLSERCVLYRDNPSKWLELFNKTNFNEVYKFGIIRHPVTKFESAFNYLKRKKNISAKLKISNRCINDYVKNVVINYDNPFLINLHFEKQYESFYFDNKLIVNDLFKIENKKDIIKLCEKLNVAKKFNKHYNVTYHLDKLEYESISILESIYSNDLKFLNYNSLLN